MIKEYIYFCKAFNEGERIQKKKFNIWAIRFSLYTGEFDSGYYAQIAIKIKDDKKYKHLIHIIETKDLLRMFDECVFKKFISKKIILHSFNKLLNNDQILFLAFKDYYRERAYKGERIVDFREVRV